MFLLNAKVLINANLMYNALTARANGTGNGHLAAFSKGNIQPTSSPPKTTKYVQKWSRGSLAAALASDLPANKRRKTCGAWGKSAAVGAFAAIGAISKPGQGVKPSGPGKRKRGPQLCSPCHPSYVSESGLEHVKRHKAEGQANNCLRCIYLSDPKALEQYAKLPLPNGSMAIWLEPKSLHQGGYWGLGCRICAWYRSNLVGLANSQPLAALGGKPKRKHRKKLVKDPELRRRGQGRFSTFANFACMKATQILKNLEQHGSSQQHELAFKAMLQKESGLEMHPQASATVGPPAINRAAQKAFKGRVPKPKDWMDCFVDSSSSVSWRKQAKLAIGKSGQTSEPLAVPEASKPDSSIEAPRNSKQCQPLAAPREIFRNMRQRRRKQCRIIAECVRKRHRRVLRKARFCTLAFDDAQGRKLLHFRCDYHKPPWYYQGTLGVIKMGAKTMEEGEEDHALRTMTRMDEFISRFCTPLRKKSLGSQCDQELKDHLLKIVVNISADGGAAERRAIFLACSPGLQYSSLRISGSFTWKS